MLLLTGPALATALFENGLQPPGVERDPYDTSLSPWYGTPNKGQWRPWDQIQDVWHLVLRYEMTIIPSGQEVRGPWEVFAINARKDGTTARYGVETDIPTLIANVALWCHAQEEPCPQ